MRARCYRASFLSRHPPAQPRLIAGGREGRFLTMLNTIMKGLADPLDGTGFPPILVRAA
jgi:hypothetical protein